MTEQVRELQLLVYLPHRCPSRAVSAGLLAESPFQILHRLVSVDRAALGGSSYPVWLPLYALLPGFRACALGIVYSRLVRGLCLMTGHTVFGRVALVVDRGIASLTDVVCRVKPADAFAVQKRLMILRIALRNSLLL